MYRTKTCGELRRANVGETVTLCGWVDSARDHSGVFFINLRDRYGKTQTVFDAAADPELFNLVKTLHNEDVAQITGEVMARPEGLTNPEMATGEIVLAAHDHSISFRMVSAASSCHLKARPARVA